MEFIDSILNMILFLLRYKGMDLDGNFSRWDSITTSSWDAACSLIVKFPGAVNAKQLRAQAIAK